MDSRLPLTWLEPLYKDPKKTVSKYTALITAIFSLYNKEHPGFPVNFLREDQKVPKANQILHNFNNENFLLHVDLPKLPGWKKIESRAEFERDYPFPKVRPEDFHQLLELTSSVHSLTKAISVGSHLRRAEVDRMDKEEIDDFEEYSQLLRQPIGNLDVKVLRLDNPPPAYVEKQAVGLLPPWPGSGFAIQVVCLPHYKSDTQAQNHRLPVIFVLDSDDTNPLGCSGVFKRVGAMHCFKCPSLNGGISACCHLAFALVSMSCPWFLEVSFNKPTRMITVKNAKFLSFLHPPEAVQTSSNRRVSDLFSCKDRKSVQKRPNCPFSNPNIPYKKAKANAAARARAEVTSDTNSDDGTSNNQSDVETTEASNNHSDDDATVASNNQSDDETIVASINYSLDEPANPSNKVSDDGVAAYSELVSEDEEGIASDKASVEGDDNVSLSQMTDVSSVVSSMYGHTRTNITKLLKTRTAKRPHIAIPGPSENKGVYFITDFTFFYHVIYVSQSYDLVTFSKTKY